MDCLRFNTEDKTLSLHINITPTLWGHIIIERKTCYHNGKVARIIKYSYKQNSNNYSKVVESDYSIKHNYRLVKRQTFSNYLSNNNYRSNVVETKKDTSKNNKINRFETYRFNNKKVKKQINIKYHANGKYSNYEAITRNSKGQKTSTLIKRYFNNGALKTKISYSKYRNGKHRKRTTSTYNSKKVIRRKEVLNYNNKFKLISKYEYRYNRYGKLKGKTKGLKAWRIRITYKNGKHLKTVRHDYNKYGRLVKA